MANLNENTTYGSPQKQSPLVNLSNLTKNLAKQSTTGASDMYSGAIVNHFYPNVAASIFSKREPISPSAGLGSLPLNTPVGEQGPGKFEGIPDYTQFVQPDENRHWVLPSDKATVRNWPTTLGGGQYITDPTQPGDLIKSERVLVNDDYNPGARSAILGGLSPKLYQLDHIVPLWIGGADTLANLQVLDIPTHQKKTAVQSVPLTLLVNGKIDLNQAKLMALTWKDKDAEGIPMVNDKGYLPLEVAEKYAQKWVDDINKPKTMKYFGEAFKEEMGNFGKGWLPTPIREFAKGLVGGGTAGIVPHTGASEDSGTVGKISNVIGNIAGTITGLGLLSKGVGYTFRGAKSLLGARKGVAIADEALKTAGLAKDIGNVASTVSKARLERLSRMANSAGLLGLWGQIGVTGKELTGQMEAELGNHTKQFLTDVAFGTLLGSAGQNIKGYTTVGLGSTSLSLMEGSDIATALQDGALMTALHGMGYRRGMVDPKTRIGNEEAYKMSAKTFNDYVGDVVPVARKGQKIPEVLTFDIPKIDNMRLEFQAKYPNDQRFKGLGTITNEAEAVAFLENAAKRNLGNMIAKSDGSIPIEDIKKEMQRITVAKNQLYNQTLPPAERVKKEWQDLISMGEKLRPGVKSDQLRPLTNTTALLDEMPFEFSQKTFDNPNKLKFPSGNVPTTGYGDNIDVVSKKTINDLYSRPSDFGSKLFVVKDPQVSSIMRIIEGEQLAAGKKSTVGNPDHTLRVFAKEATPDGIIVRPAGYLPREVSFDAKKNNLNKTYYEITDRLRHTIKTSKTPADLQASLNADKAAISITEKEAATLFERKADLAKMSDEELYAILKPANAYEKYDSKLNNSTIAQEMDKLGLDVLVVDTSKVMPIGGGPPRYNPDNPYLSLNLNEQDWLRSLALKEGRIDFGGRSQKSPVQTGIKNVVSKEKSKDLTKTVAKFQQKQKVDKPINTGEISQKELPLMKTKAEPSPIKPPIEPKMTQEAPIEAKAPSTPKGVYKAIEKRFKNPSDAAVTEFFNDLVDKIESMKVKPSSPQTHEKILKDGIENFKRKNPGLSESDFKYAMDTAKNRARSFVENLIDDTYKGTEYFGTSDRYSRAPKKDSENVLVKRFNELKKREADPNVTFKSFEKMEMKEIETKIKQHIKLDEKVKVLEEKGKLTPAEEKELQKLKKDRFTLTEDYRGPQDASLVLANKFDLKLQPANERGMRFLELDKKGNPMFSEEYIKAHPGQNKSPSDVWGSFLDDEMRVYRDKLSNQSRDWAKGISEMKKSNNPYAKGFANAVDAALKEKFDVRGKDGQTLHAYEGSWKLNSVLKGMKNWFNLVNEEGYSRSQPFRRTSAITGGKNYKEIEKAVGKADAETKAISEKAREERLDTFGSGSEPILPSGMRVKDPNQIKNVSEDLTPFDMMTNGLLAREVRSKLISDYNNIRKELGGASSERNKALLDEMKDIFEQIKKLSSNLPGEVKKWKLGSKIDIKGGGEPTFAEGVQDGLRLSGNLFRLRKSPGFVNFDKIKELLLKDQPTPTKKDGQGGPYDGQGGFWGGIKNFFSGKETYQKPPEPEYDVRGLKLKDADINEIGDILYGEVSNRPGKQAFEAHHAINVGINRALANPKKYNGSLVSVFQEPAQFQSYAPQGMYNSKGQKVESQYQKLKKGQYDEAKRKAILEAMELLKSGKFTDTTGGKQFYVHASDGSMWLGSTLKEAKDLANQREKELGKQITNWKKAPGLPVAVNRSF